MTRSSLWPKCLSKTGKDCWVFSMFISTISVVFNKLAQDLTTCLSIYFRLLNKCNNSFHKYFFLSLLDEYVCIFKLISFSFSPLCCCWLILYPNLLYSILWLRTESSSSQKPAVVKNGLELKGSPSRLPSDSRSASHTPLILAEKSRDTTAGLTLIRVCGKV